MKFILKVFSVIILFWWLALSHVSFISNENLSFIHKEDNSDYIAKWYMTKSINPIGAWFNITSENTTAFAVLLDKNGNYIGQSSPFYLSDWADSHLPSLNETMFFSLGGEKLETAYSISIYHRNWWDYILKYFYQIQN